MARFVAAADKFKALNFPLVLEKILGKAKRDRGR